MSSTDVVVRVASEDDIGALADLRSLWAGESGNDPEFERRLAEWLAAEGERRTTWLATAGDRAAGMASLFEYRRMPKPGHPASRWGYLGNLFVRADHRRRGVGFALLSAVVAAADRRSHARVVVSPSNEALPLLRRTGFVMPGDASAGEVLLVRPGSAGR